MQFASYLPRDIQTCHKAIVLLVKNGFIYEFKVEKYGQILRLTQEVIRLYMVKRRLTNNYNIENKLLDILHERFSCEIYFHGVFFTKESLNVVGHVTLIFNKKHVSFEDKIKYLEIKLNYACYLIHKT